MATRLDEHDDGATRPSRTAPGRSSAVSLLGGFRLLTGPEPTVLPPGCQRLLVFLALRGLPVRRGLAAGTLWPDASETRAHASLRSAIARLHRAAWGVVEADPVDIGLAGGAAVDFDDAREVAGAVLSGPARPMDAVTARAAISILSQELLPGWYEEWVLLESENWRQLRLHALEALAVRLLATKDYADATLAALAAVRAEPLRESAHVALVQVYLAEGNRSEALRAYERFRRILWTEFAIEPTDELAGLVARLHPVPS